MVNTERITKTFCDLVRVDSIGGQERQMADMIRQKLSALGYSSTEDNAGDTIGGNAGNVIVKIPGNNPAAPLLFMAHMDTVEPGHGKVPVIQGDLIKSEGTTVLGGDDLAGVACILEAIAVLKEENISHGDIYAVFTIAEEGGLFGARALDVSAIPAKFAYVLDDEGPIGTAAIKAPNYNRLRFNVKGKAAHAGLCPEEGLNAIRIAAAAIAGLPFMGRIDQDSTCNIGMIQGGRARNIVPDQVIVDGEVRSLENEKLASFTGQLTDSFCKTVEREGGTVEIEVENMYGGYSITEDHPIIRLMKKAASRLNIPVNLHATGGGSDTNIINGKGIPAVDISVGMSNVHSTTEQIAISDMVKASQLMVEIIRVHTEEVNDRHEENIS
ncbi:MAG: M20/M25/M40 family metallo-hydrolase [Thermoclostridium sp.]|nr:M20/M25/M40 family metallo-hydrolase [Thermoclostridium sp.]